MKHETLHGLFDAWRLPKTIHIQWDRFLELVNQWGFIAPESDIKSLFDWLDKDKDGRLSFEDIRETIGLDVSPK